MFWLVFNWYAILDHEIETRKTRFRIGWDANMVTIRLTSIWSCWRTNPDGNPDGTSDNIWYESIGSRLVDQHNFCA